MPPTRLPKRRCPFLFLTHSLYEVDKWRKGTQCDRSQLAEHAYRIVSVEDGVEAVGEPDDAAVETDAARDAI